MAERKLSILIPEVILGVIGVAALIGLVIVLDLGRRGLPPSNVWSGYATIALVLVTLVNVSLSGIALLESRRERQLSRESLRENRRERVIEFINDSIIELREQIIDETETITGGGQTSKGYSIYHYNSAQEFEEIDEKLPELVDEYIELKNQALDERSSIMNKLTGNDADEHWPEDVKSDLLGVLPEDIEFNDVRANYIVISGTVMSETPGVIPPTWIDEDENKREEIFEILTGIQDNEDYEDHFRRHRQFCDELSSKSKEIVGVLDMRKVELMKEYWIYSTELNEY